MSGDQKVTQQSRIKAYMESSSLHENILLILMNEIISKRIVNLL